MVNFWLLLAVGAGGALAGCLYLLVGGAGVARTLRQRIVLLEDETEQLANRITREVKTRAAMAAVDKRREAVDMKELQAEAERRLVENRASERPLPGGFPYQLKR